MSEVAALVQPPNTLADELTTLASRILSGEINATSAIVVLRDRSDGTRRVGGYGEPMYPSMRLGLLQWALIELNQRDTATAPRVDEE